MTGAAPLAGRTALVTGAAGGIGTEVARRLAAGGARVVLTDLEAAGVIGELAEELGGSAFPADLGVARQIEDLLRRTAADVGPVDLLIANAAAMSMGPVASQDLGEWWRMIDVNLTGTFLLAQAVAPGMRASGGGRIVVITSEWGVIGWPGASGYSASKAGLVALVKSLGRELARDGIAVNGVAPSVVDTPQLQVDAAAAGISLDEMRREYAARIPLGRLAHPDEIAAVVAYLCGPDAGSMVGQIVQPNGGSTRSRV